VTLSLYKEQIKSKQLFSSAERYLKGITVLMLFVKLVVKNHTLVFMSAGPAAGLFIAWIVMTFVKSYPLKTLFAINDIVLAQKAGKATSIFILLSFLVLLLLYIRKVGDLIFCFSVALLLEKSLYVFCRSHVCIDAYYNKIARVI